MLRQLVLVLSSLALQIFYGANPPASFPQSSFLIGLLRIPLFAVLALVNPSNAVLVRTTTGHATWCPRGLEITDAILLALFAFAMSRDMDLVAGICESSLWHFEIYLPFLRHEFSLRTAIVMSVASVLAFNLGKYARLWFVPIFERTGVLKWDPATVEETEDAERVVEGWQALEGTGFW